MKKYLAATAVLAVGVGGLGMFAAPANAAPLHHTTCSVPRVIKAYDAAINHRLHTLSALGKSLTKVTAVSSTNRTTAQQILATDTTNLTALKATIDASTTCSALKALGPQITKNYRVYALVVPQIRLLEASSIGLQSTAAVQAEIPALTAFIKAAELQGKDVTAQEAELSTVTTRSAAALTAFAPVPSAVLSLTPADVNARNGKLHAEAHATAVGAANLAKAAQAAAQIVTSLS